MNRRRNRYVACWVLLTLLFAQVATAAYACPFVLGAFELATPDVEQSTPCADMAQERISEPSVLCFEHCKPGQQLLETHPSIDQCPSVPAFVILVAPADADGGPRWVAIEPPLTRMTSPPALASSNRLRI